MVPTAVTPLAPEIVWFTPSQEYLEDPTTVLPVLHQRFVDKGLLNLYYGFELDQVDSGVWVMAWRSLAHHQDFMQQESYVNFILPAMDCMVGTGRISQLCVDNIEEFWRALDSPVTAFLYITVRPLHDRDYELEPLVAKLQSELRTVPGCLASSWGSALQDDHVEIGVVGWETVDDRNRAVEGPLHDILHNIRELSRIELRYARLRSL